MSKASNYSETFRTEYWTDYVTHCESYEAPAITALQSMFNAQKIRALDDFNSGKRNNLLDKEVCKIEYAQAMTPVLTQVMHHAINAGEDLAKPVTPHKDGIPHVINQNALTWLKTRITWAAEQIGLESEARLSQVLQDGFSQGLSTQDIANNLMAEFDDFSKTRANMIARTEILGASNQGNQLGYKAAGVTKEEWLTARNEKVCETCAPMDGEIFPIEDFPTPPFSTHPNCRCVGLPVID